MIARKGVGQLRQTEAEINRCPISHDLNSNVYAARIITQYNSNKAIVSPDEKNYFLNKLRVSFEKRGIRIEPSAIPHMVIQFKKASSSFIKNTRVLTGSIIVVGLSKDTQFTSSFTVSTHKSIYANENLLGTLAVRIASCFPNKSAH